MREWETPFAETLDRMPKHVVSRTLDVVDWNAELLQGDLGDAVRALKAEPGRALAVGGVTLPRALADLGLIDEYTFVVHPVLAGHGPTLLSGLRKRIRLDLVESRTFDGKIQMLEYIPRVLTGPPGTSNPNTSR